MERKIDTITKEALRQAGCLCISRLSEGLTLYSHRFLEGSEEELWQQLQQRLLANGAECTYFDFYYGALTPEEQKRAHAVLTAEQISYLEALSLSAEQIYFRYSEKLFEIAFQLSVKSMLFSTFYFAGEPETVWSNYERKFIVFKQD